MVVTLRDVAREAGVSASAVSRSFTAGAPVPAETRARVREVADRLGFRPNRLASGLTSGRTGLIALAVHDLGDPMVLAGLQGATRRLAAAGCTPLLVDLGGAAEPASVIAPVRDYRAEAVLLMAPHLPPAFARALTGAGLVVGRAFGRAMARSPMPQAGIGHADAARLAARILTGRGYRDLVCLVGPDAPAARRDLEDGFTHMAERAGARVRPIRASGWTVAAGARALATDLARARPPDAVFAADPRLARGAARALAAAGLGVPRDVGLLALDCAEAPGGPSALALPCAEIAGTAADLLLRMLADREAEATSLVLPVVFTDRGTLRPEP